MNVDIVTRRSAIAALAGMLLPAPAFSIAPPMVGALDRAKSASIPPGARAVTVTVGAGGKLAVPFVADDGLDAGFAATHSRAAFVARDGRIFRLDGSAISVEAFGAVADGISNDQPAIQAAIRYAEAVHAPMVRFLSARYAVHGLERREPLTVNSAEGHPIVISGQITLQGRPKLGSTIQYRSVNGGSLATNWQVVGGKVWRGAGIFLQGLVRPPADPADLPSAGLIDMTLDGGCDRTTYYGYPARVSDGDGWDETHKGLWAQNDRFTGDWRVTRSKIVRFRGEVFYQGGSGHGAFIGRQVTMGQTNADILNPCGTNLDIVDGYFYDGNSGWEGWGGRNGQLLRCRFERCRSMGGIQGGRANTTGGSYFIPHRFDDGVNPWLTLDVTLIDCGQVSVGNWVRGRITMVDSFLYLSSGVFPTIHDVDLQIIAQAERKSLDCAVALAGGKPGSLALGRIRLRLTIGATAAGRVSGHGYRQPVAWGGSLGPDISIDVRTQGRLAPSKPSYKATDVVPHVTTSEAA